MLRACAYAAFVAALLASSSALAQSLDTKEETMAYVAHR
jgi:hypothetical protein